MSSRVDRSPSDREISVFLGHGSWINELWMAGGDLTPPQRRARVAAWLARNGISVLEDYLDVLALCESASEVRFVLPIVTLVGWRRLGNNGFSNGHYTLHLQVPVLDYRVDFLLRGEGLKYPCAIEIDGPSHEGGRQVRYDRDRDFAMLRAGVGVYRIGVQRLAEEAARFRRAFMLESLASPALSTAVVPLRERQRAWPRNAWAYNVEGIPYDERCYLVRSWLASRGVQVDTDQAEYLAHCDRAGEVLLIQPLICRPEWSRLGDRTFTDGLTFITVQEPFGPHVVDVVFERDATEPGDAHFCLLADVCVPPYLRRDFNTERRKQKELEEAGYLVQRVEVDEVLKTSQRWLTWVQWTQERSRRVRTGDG